MILMTEVTTKMGLRERKQKLTKNVIWDAAIDLFMRKGFDGTTLDEIAESAQIARSSFFRYFESKDDLIAQPITNLADSLAKAVASCPRPASNAELFRYVVSALATESAADPRTKQVMEIAAKYPSAREALTSRGAGIHDQIEQAFRRRCKEALMVQVLSSLTLSALSLTIHHWFANGQKDIAASTRKVFAAIAGAVRGLDELGH